MVVVECLVQGPDVYWPLDELNELKRPGDGETPGRGSSTSKSGPTVYTRPDPQLLNREKGNKARRKSARERVVLLTNFFA